MKIAAQGTASLAATLWAADGKRGAAREGFKELVKEEAKETEHGEEGEQSRTIASLEQENKLHGLGNMEEGLRQRINHPRLVSIHRRILPDGSCMVCEKSGNSMVSHYSKHLNLGQPEKNVDIHR